MCSACCQLDSFKILIEIIPIFERWVVRIAAFGDAFGFVVFVDGFGEAVELLAHDQLGGRGFFDAAETLDGSLEIGAVFDFGEELGEAGVGGDADVDGAVVELQIIPECHARRTCCGSRNRRRRRKW